MKKFIATLLSCSLICGNAFATQTRNEYDKPPKTTETSGNNENLCGLSCAKKWFSTKTTKEKRKYGLTAGGSAIGLGGIVTGICIAAKKCGNKTNPSNNSLLEQYRHIPRPTLWTVPDDWGEYNSSFELLNHFQIENGNETETNSELKAGDKINVKANPHVVLNGEEFREYLKANQSAALIFRGVRFKSIEERSQYRNDFINQGLLISTSSNADGADLCRKAGRLGRGVYFSGNPQEALEYSCADNGKPYRALAVAVLMPTYPKNKLVWDDSNTHVGYPDVNEHFVLCSDFFEYESTRFCSRDYAKLSNYDFNPDTFTNPEEKNTIAQIRKFQIHLLKMGIVVTGCCARFDPNRADTLLDKLEKQ